MDPLEALGYALATWVYLLHVEGTQAAVEHIATSCAAVTSATEEDEGNAAGEQLVLQIREELKGASPEAVQEFATALYGERCRTDLGEGTREQRVHKIRKYHFVANRPWLARIWERSDSGVVAPQWIVVERVTDEVLALDPNPWNDIDETKRYSLSDFHVLWELGGCTSIYIQ